MTDDDLGNLLGKALQKAFQEADEGGSEKDGNDGLPEVQEITLREHFEHYVEKNPYKPGDLVTPRPGVNQMFAGRPMIVIESLAEPIRTELYDHESKSLHTPTYGGRLDIRAVLIHKGNACPFWYEHWQLERYNEDVKKRKKRG